MKKYDCHKAMADSLLCRKVIVYVRLLAIRIQNVRHGTAKFGRIKIHRRGS